MMDSDESDPDAGLYQSSDDEDYVPDGASGDDDDDDYTIKKGKSKAKGKTKLRQTKKVAQKPTRRSSRKRSGGICLREPDSDEESDEPLASSESEEEEESEDAEENYENQEEQKKRVDNIWTSMKNDKNVKKNSKTLEEEEDLEGDAKREDSIKEKIGSVNEMKEGDEDKDEKQNVSEKQPNNSQELADLVSGETEKADAKSEIQPAGAGKKRSGGLSNVVGSLNKKSKLSTLEKSKLDWDTFKKDKGLEDELRNNSKDGYLGKQEFLQRVDYRTWENERELRLETGRGKK